MPLDFAKLLRKLEDKEGVCHLPYFCFDTIDGIRIDCVTLKERPVKLHYTFEYGENGLIFRILDGVTGYESYYVWDLLNNPCSDWWYACCMTPNHWDGLKVNGQQVLDKIRLKTEVFT